MKKILFIISVAFILLLTSCVKSKTVVDSTGNEIKSKYIYQNIEDSNYKILFAEDGYLYTSYLNEGYKNTGFEWMLDDYMIITTYKDSKTEKVITSQVYFITSDKKYLANNSNGKNYIYILTE